MYTPARSVTAVVTAALADEFATLVAVTVCTPGWVPGVNNPPAVIVPVWELPLGTPSIIQVTPELLGSLKTVAVNCCFCDRVSEEPLGLSVTLIGPKTTVMAAVADLVVSAADVAVSVTLAGLGTVGGPV